MIESKSPIQCLLNTVLGEGRFLELADLKAFIEKNPSVFDLIEQGVEGLRILGLQQEEAHRLDSRARAVATFIARAFREQALRPEGQTLFPLRALRQGPTYSRLFSPNYALCSPKGSIQSSYSTTAYLVELREWVSKLESTGSQGDKLLLDTRRPDLGQTYIDHLTVDRVVPSMEIVSQVLASQIKSRLGEEDVDAVLRRVRYPNGLPHDQSYQSIEAVLKLAGYESLGDILRLVDPDAPYFIHPSARGSKSDIAMRLSLELGPVRQALLLEPGYFSATTGEPEPGMPSDFYRDNFGYIGPLDLKQLWVFYLATQLDQQGVEALFALGDFMPLLSENAPALVNPEVEVSGAVYGAAFIHGALDPLIHAERNPPIGLARTGPADTFELQNVDDENQHRMDRINRKCRLDRWLRLASSETDQLMMAANHAERRGHPNTAVWVTDNMLRAIGLFQELRAQYQCSVRDFSVFIDVLSVYGQNEELSHFDQVYNSQSVYIEPLRIDNVEFAVIPRSEADQSTVHQICAGLQINFETYRYLSAVIADAFGYSIRMPRSLAVFSSFYRLVRLARLFGVTPVEATALLQALGGEVWIVELAGAPQVSSHVTGEETDVLSVIRALMSAVQWCKANDFSVLWLVQNIGPVSVPTVATEVQKHMLQRLREQAQPVLFLEVMLLEEGVYDPQEPGRWLTALAALIDVTGLVKSRYEETEADYLQWARKEIDLAVEDVIPDTETEERDYARTTILSVLLRVRAEQRSAVYEVLAVHLGLSSDRVAGVLFWAEGSAFILLERALAGPENAKVKWTGPEPEPVEPFLKLLMELERRSRIVSRLALSAEMLDTLLTEEQYEWFSLESRYEISIKTLYYLVFYTKLLLLAQQPEAKVLDYLRQVNQLPEYLDPDPRRLVRDAAAEKLAQLFRFGIRHVLDCVAAVVPVDANGNPQINPVLRNLAQLDLLSRTQEMSGNGLDAATGFLLGALTPRAPESEFAQAAQRVLETLAKPQALKVAQQSGEVGQTVSTRCVVDTKHLIANLAHDYAEFECTVLDFYGEPLKGVPVHWTTTRGVLRETLTRTDAQGKTGVQLQAGSTMGVAHVAYRLDLREAVYAPAVVIGCHEESLAFPSELMSTLPREPVLAGGLGEVEIYAVLLDEFGNRAPGRLVVWRTTLGTIQPGETFTDSSGTTRVRLISQEEGEAHVSVTYPDTEVTAQFNGKVTFEDMPYLEAAPYAISAAVLGQPLSVQCRVVGLDGAPQVDETVLWWTSKDPARLSTISNQDGLCTLDLNSLTQGPLTVFVQHGADRPLSLDLLVAAAALIADYSADVRFPVAGATKPSLFWIDVREERSPAGLAVPNVPIEWQVDTVPAGGAGFPITTTIATDVDGRSVLPFLADTAGQYRITASVAFSADENRPFDVTVVEAINWRVTLESTVNDIAAQEVIVPGSGELKLYSGREYTLSISTSSSIIHGKKAALGWSSKPDYPSSSLLGLTFDPPLAQEYDISDQPKAWIITISGIRRGPFTLGLYVNELDEVLALDGSLSRAPS